VYVLIPRYERLLWALRIRAVSRTELVVEHSEGAPGLGETRGRSDGGYWAFLSSGESDRCPGEQNLFDLWKKRTQLNTT
jgi:hypothetical protein